MGFAWGLGFAAAAVNNIILWGMFELSVPLQGIFIFAAFVCKASIWKKYKALFGSVKGKLFCL